MNRRQFLTALGLGSGAAFLPPLLPSLGRDAMAEGPSGPKRVIFMVTQQGAWDPAWAFNPAGLPLDQPWTFELGDTSQAQWSPSLAPLHPHRDKLTILDGLALASGDADPASALRHEIGQVQALTGDFVEIVAGIPQARAPSLDQVLADHLARPDRLRSIEIGVGQAPFTVNYRDRLQLLPTETRPDVVWDRLFGRVSGAGGSAVGSVLQREQGAVLDRVHARYAELAPHLGAEDRAKLELHRDLIRDLGVQLEGLAEAECSAPSRPQLELDYDQSFSVNVEMLRAAMACDLVRVATLYLGNIPAERLGYPGTDIHNDFAHEVHSDPTAQQVMTDYGAYHASQLAELMSALDEVPDGDGSLLDHTLIVWVSELGDGTHGFDKWPCVLAGGQQWRNGRMVHLPRDLPFETWTWDGAGRPTTGHPHQRLLNSIAEAFGVPGAEPGTPWRAPLRELEDRLGQRLDAGGVIDELFV